jgi:hypothetical protein
MRYIIIDPYAGIFLGTKSDKEFWRNNVGMLFSGHNIFEITRAVSWDSYNVAYTYMHTYCKEELPDCFVAEIESNNTYVDIGDICKAGFGDYGTEMIDALPMPSLEVH